MRQHLKIGFSILLALIFIGSSVAHGIGERCIQNCGSPGTCQKLKDCPPAITVIRNGLVPRHCGFIGRNPVVCCPPWTGGATRKTTPKTQPTISATILTTPTIPTEPRLVDNSPVAIVKRKCEEYARWAFRTVPSSVNLLGNETERESLCVTDAVPIVGGHPAVPGEFPHMVAVGYGPESDISWLCGGTLISENFVLSAAHCSFSGEGPAKWAMIGELQLSPTAGDGRVGENGRILQIVERIRHPDYKVPSKYHDICLMKIAPLESDKTGPLIPSQPISEEGSHPFFSKFIRPACLHENFQLPDTEITATGWGKFGYADESSPNLLEVKLSLIDSATCNESYKVEATTDKLQNGIDNTVFCAGELEGGKDTCQGDSGGPLQIERDDFHCMFSVIGITSFGKLCGFKNSPAVYTRVSNYIPWIVGTVWPQG